MGFPGDSGSKEFAHNAGDLGSISGLERSPGEGNGYPPQYSCLENSIDRRAWQATVHREDNRLPSSMADLPESHGIKKHILP